MTRTMILVLLALASLGFVQANRHPYRVLFDLTSRDSLDQRSVLRWLREVASVSPDAEMEVVMYGRGFELIMPEPPTELTPPEENDPEAKKSE